MTPTPPNRPRPVSLKWRAAVAGLLLAAAPAAAELPFPTRPVAEAESDGSLLRRAEAALAADAALARLPVVVSVVDGVAVVGGPVPDAATIPKIEAALRAVPGLKVVKVSCWVPAADDPFARAVADRMNAAPPPAAPPDLRAFPPLALGPTAAPPSAPVPVPAVVAAPSPKPAPSPEPEPRPEVKVTAARASDPGPTAGFLLDPVAPAGKTPRIEPDPPPAPAYPTIPPPAVPTRPVSVTRTPRADPVAEARASDPRFAGLAVRMDGGTAVISGRAADPADAWDFARLLRGQPGVGRVVVGYVR